jgi:hypothetical protein
MPLPLLGLGAGEDARRADRAREHRPHAALRGCDPHPVRPNSRGACS